MDTRNQRDDERDEAHQANRTGLRVFDTCPSPGPVFAATEHTSNEVIFSLVRGRGVLKAPGLRSLQKVNHRVINVEPGGLVAACTGDDGFNQHCCTRE